jgi:predicted membrane-bound mannosyltransferase
MAIQQRAYCVFIYSLYINISVHSFSVDCSCAVHLLSHYCLALTAYAGTVLQGLKSVAQRLMADLAAVREELHSSKAAAAAADAHSQQQIAAVELQQVASNQAISDLQQQLAAALAACATAETLQQAAEAAGQLQAQQSLAEQALQHDQQMTALQQQLAAAQATCADSDKVSHMHSKYESYALS